MQFLYTFDELFSITTNGWSCPACGKAWADTGLGYAVPVVPGADPSCRHPKMNRARITEG